MTFADLRCIIKAQKRKTTGGGRSQRKSPQREEEREALKEKVVNKVMTDVKDGDIILLHDGYDSSMLAAFEIIDRLQAQGYEFVTVDKLIFELP